MKTRIQARVITLDRRKQALLLARNPGAQFWYAPGGGLEDGEDIKQCAMREMQEETGLQVDLKRFLYAQELHDTATSTVIIELFWLAEPSRGQSLNRDHADLDPEGGIAEARWFTKDQLQGITVYPEELKGSFWENVERFYEEEDRFLGTVG